MNAGAPTVGSKDDLRHGFTIGDVRVAPATRELGNEDGDSVTLSPEAMQALVALAAAQRAA